MAQVTITELPTASALTGNESVPVVQDGVTKQTTTGAIAGAGALNYPFLTVGQTSGLAQSRYISTNAGLSLTDNGAQGTLVINLEGAALSLNSSGTGIQVKTGSNTVTARQIAVNSGLTITNGDGVSGNPTIGLGTVLSGFAGLTGTGILAVQSGNPAKINILGTSSQTTILNGDGSSDVTVSLANNPVLPGTAGTVLPIGGTAARPGSPTNGTLRYNSDSAVFEGYANNAWGSIATGSGVTSIQTGTGLTGGPITSTGTISIANTAVTTGTYGSSNYVPTFTVNQQGQLTFAGETEITPSGIGAISQVNGTTDQITTSQVGTVVTVAIADAPSLVGPVNIDGTVKLTGTGASPYTPFIQTFSSAVTNFNGYQLNYIENKNNGSDASVDYVAYNDASDVDSYFIDMGIVSSNYSSVLNTVFPANSGYVYTGGGSSGQAAPLLLGTSNAASDIIFFTGGTLLANTRAAIKGNGNFLIGTSTDTGYLLNVAGTTYFGGASTFGSTVLLNANPTLPLQAVTKQYVDAAVATGFVVHTAVRAASTTNLATIYNNGSSGVGATLTADTNRAFNTLDGATVTVGQRVLIKNQTSSYENGAYTLTDAGSAGVSPWVLTRATDFDVVGAGEVANNAYFYVQAGTTNAGSSWVLNQLAAITIGTTALPFDLFASSLVYTGGTNIDVTGQVISLTGTVAATNGGTGTATVTTGDLLYGSATNTWSKLPLGIAYKSLVVNASGTQMEWNAVALNQTSAVSGQLGTTNGGTGTSVGVAGGAF